MTHNPLRWTAIAATALAVSCSSPEEEPELERPGDGQWFRGDMHVHAAGASNDAAPQSTPEKIREVAVERGMDFVVLTDHSNSTGSDPWTLEEDPALFNQGPEFPFWDRALGLSGDEFLMVQGNEISPVHTDTGQPTGHIGCIPSTLDDFDPDVAFVDRPRGEVTGGEALEQALEVGCFAILNHPFGPTPWISYDWTSYDYDAMEVWNGGVGFSFVDRDAVKGWACDLSQGRQVTPVGASDNHVVDVEPPGTLADPPLGTPVTWVWVDSLDWDEIVDALYAGEVAVGDGDRPLEIDVFDADGEWLAMAGGEFSASQEKTVRIRGARDNDDGDRVLELVRVPSGACDDHREVGEINVPEPNWEIVEEWTIGPEEDFEHTTVVEGESGDVFFAWMRPEVIANWGDDVGITGAVFVE